MTDGATVTVQGLDQLLAEVRDLAPKIRERVLLGACAKACSVIKNEAKRRAPMFTGDVAKGHPPPGTLQKAIYQTRMVEKCTTTQEVWKVDVRRGSRKITRGAKAGEKTNDRDAYYAMWVEFGHYTRVPVAMTKTAKAAGRALGVATFVSPHPFMRPAIESKRAEALQTMAAYIGTKLPLATAMNTYLKAA